MIPEPITVATRIAVPKPSENNRRPKGDWIVDHHAADAGVAAFVLRLADRVELALQSELIE